MSNYFPPAPTWRLCHPVNIFCYRNGVAEKPNLVHIPMEKKKNMNTVLEAIGARMKLPVGYPVALYHMDGQRVCKTYELEMYNNYVVVTNLEKRFKCIDYGKVRDPLVVIGRHSKHVNTLRLQNKRFDLFCRRKMARKPLHELMANSGDQDGLGPSELPVGKPCGALCHKVTPRRDRPTQCCSDEIMCVEGAAMDLERDDCRVLQREMNTKCFDDARRSLDAPPGTTIADEDCRLVEELQRQVKDSGVDTGGGVGPGGGSGPLGMGKNLVDLMLRYKDVGSDIFKLFQDKINKDLDGDAQGKVSARWQIPGGSSLSLETQQRVKEELIRLAEQSCQFTFDKHGNFLFSEGCRIPGQGGSGRLSNAAVGTEEMPQQATSKRSSGAEGEAKQKRLSQLSQQGAGGASSGGIEKRENSQGAMEGQDVVVTNMLEVEVDEENNVSSNSIPGLTKSDSKKIMMMEEATGTSQMSLEAGEEEAEEKAAEVESELARRSKSSKQRVSRMQSEITEIVGNMRRSLVMSRSNSLNGGALPPAMNNLPSPPRTLAAVQEEAEEDEGGTAEEEEIVAAVKATISGGSNKSYKSNKSNKSNKNGSKRADDGGNDEEEGDASAGGNVNVFSLIMESRNPFREGIVPPLAGKLHKDRLEKLFAENPFRKSWYHGEATPRRGEHEEEDLFLKHDMLPPEGFNIPRQSNTHDGINDASPLFSPRASKTEWWPPKRPDVFLQQINELLQRHDNTKATSPPPPPFHPTGSDSMSTFTIGPSPRDSRTKMVNVACGQSRTQVSSKVKTSFARHRNVCAQVGTPQTDEVEVEEYREEMLSPMRRRRCYEGGTQTRKMMPTSEVETLEELPSEDEKPAGIYEGYQESIKCVHGLPSESDNDGDDERKLYYRKRRENRRIRRKRKELYLHPLSSYSPEEEDSVDDTIEDKPFYVPQTGQQVGFVINGGGVHIQQYPQSSSMFPGISPSHPQRQQFFVQATSTTPTALPLLARHSSQDPPPTVIKSMQQRGGLVAGTGPQIQLPLMITQHGGRAGFLLPSSAINNNNNGAMTSSTSPLSRHPIIFTTQSPLQHQQQSAKLFPVLQPQSMPVRLIKLVHSPQQAISSSSSAPTNGAGADGTLQNKLVQMMSPRSLQPVFFPAQQQTIPRPQPQQLISTRQQQIMFK